MEIESVWTVMKWVLLVLLAGFIGQFGKSFAQQVLKKLRREKDAPVESSGRPVVQVPESPRNQTSATAERRAPDRVPAPASPETPQIADKKLLKALAKQKKREAKARKKP